VLGQRLLGHSRQHRHPVLGALAIADDDLVHGEVNILHPQAGAFEHP